MAYLYTIWKIPTRPLSEGEEHKLKYHLDTFDTSLHELEQQTVLCGAIKRFGGNWETSGEELLQIKANEAFICKRCLKIAKAKGLWNGRT